MSLGNPVQPAAKSVNVYGHMPETTVDNTQDDQLGLFMCSPQIS